MVSIPPPLNAENSIGRAGDFSGIRRWCLPALLGFWTPLEEGVAQASGSEIFLPGFLKFFLNFGAPGPKRKPIAVLQMTVHTADVVRAIEKRFLADRLQLTLAEVEGVKPVGVCQVDARKIGFLEVHIPNIGSGK